jgi:hypothetical protein
MMVLLADTRRRGNAARWCDFTNPEQHLSSLRGRYLE